MLAPANLYYSSHIVGRMYVVVKLGSKSKGKGTTCIMGTTMITMIAVLFCGAVIVGKVRVASGKEEKGKRKKERALLVAVYLPCFCRHPTPPPHAIMHGHMMKSISPALRLD